MRNARTDIAGTARRVRPHSRLDDRSCMFVMTMSVAIWGPKLQFETGLNRKTRV
jgi:hypothetical protein